MDSVKVLAWLVKRKKLRRLGLRSLRPRALFSTITCQKKRNWVVTDLPTKSRGFTSKTYSEARFFTRKRSASHTHSQLFFQNVPLSRDKNSCFNYLWVLLIKLYEVSLIFSVKKNEFWKIQLKKLQIILINWTNTRFVWKNKLRPPIYKEL